MWWSRFMQWLDKELAKHRPNRQPSDDQEIIDILADDFERLAANSKIIKLDYVRSLIKDHEFTGQPFEFSGNWFRIVGTVVSHRH
ncbi:MAG: hypothetical protein Q7T49_02020 [bacterium]|nr:hypothetical protein [bacterium]